MSTYNTINTHGVAQLTLYHMKGCPFCIKVTKHLDTLGLNVVYKDIRDNDTYLTELAEGSNKTQVPCLKIEFTDDNTVWLHESDEIVAYLSKYAQTQQQAS